MTNKEAIKIIKGWMQWSEGCLKEAKDLKATGAIQDFVKDVEACKLAIEALGERESAYWQDDGGVLICSNCKGISDAYFDCYDERFEFNGVKGWARRYPAYCKRCGSKMDKATIDEREFAELMDDLFKEENDGTAHNI